MKKIGRLFLLVGALLLASCHHSLTSYVNPLVGTDGHGHTFPGAVLPFGMVQVSPDTRLDGWDGCSGYHYSDDTIYGFSHTHLSGTGCSDYGDVLIMPFTEDNGAIPDSLGYDFYKSSFTHRNEIAEPGYYRVMLGRNRVMAELTVAKRVAMHKYTFPHQGRNGVVIDLKHRDVVRNSWIRLYDETTGTQAGTSDDEGCESRKQSSLHTIVTGGRISAAWNPEQHLYFAIAADCAFDIVYFKDGKAVDSHEIEGEDCKAMLLFPENEKDVVLTVAISAVDEHGALLNLRDTTDEAQMSTTSFEQARKQASAIWEKALGQFEVEGGTEEDRANFYTALYHCMTSPYLFSDVDGRYRKMEDGRWKMEENDSSNQAILPDRKGTALSTDEIKSNTAKKQSSNAVYTVFSVWDTYRALHPLLNLTDPKRSRDFVLTMLDHYRSGGELTMWELAGYETHCMIGYHAASVILDAYRTGVLDDLPDETLYALLDAMVATSNLPMLGRTEYARDGFLSSEYENESVSKTLEYSYDDWCIAMFAKSLDEAVSKRRDTLASIESEYLRRSQSWKNIMDADGFMHPRRNGAFVTPFDPTEVNNHFTEANSWQYSSYVPHDVEGWIAMLGGADKAERFLDSLFYGNSTMTGREQSDITGVIGQYAHGNEPSHHAAYLYAYLGRQWKTAELIRRICHEQYHDSPDGLCGNEDCGQMSAWYVMSAMGFYPVCPGSGQYVVGSPLFDKVTIHLQNGKDIVINAKGQGKNNCYISSLKLNGTVYDKAFITFEQLRDGCVLDFEMSSTPVKEWGIGERKTENDRRDRMGATGVMNGERRTETIVRVPVFDDWQQSFDGETTVKISADGAIYYTLDGSVPTEGSYRYTEPLTIANDAIIKARCLDTANNRWSSVVTHRLTRTLADRKLSYVTKPNPQYIENGEKGLIDRMHGSENYRIGGWQGWQEDCIVVVDMLNPRVISHVGIECLENMRSWIFFPRQVVVEVSLDGSSWSPFGTIDNTQFAATIERQEEANVYNFAVGGSAYAQYVRIKAVNYGKLPKWHVSAGEQAWLFADEVEVW